MKAVIETGGKQYYVEKDSILYVEKLKQKVGEEVIFDQILMLNGITGRPYHRNARVVGEVLKHGKRRKYVIFKYRPKKSSHTKQGHRQPYTKVKINKIEIVEKKND